MRFRLGLSAWVDDDHHRQRDKARCDRLAANQTGLQMGGLAYNLLHMIRQFPVWGEKGKWSVERLIKRLIRVGARVFSHARRWQVQVASALPLAHHERAVLARGGQAAT